MSDTWKFETRQIHAGQSADSATGARALPIYQTTSYVFKDTNHAANLFALKEFGNIYTRLMNPTTDVVEQRIAALEGGVGALLVASGQAAETLAILNIAEAGSHVVASPSLYGGTFNLLKFTLPKYGNDVTFVDNPNDPQAWRDAVRPNTKLFFGESISNPKVEVLDIEAIAAVAHEAGVPLIVDNTIATPYLIRPLEWGADFVVHSATKYLSGHSDLLLGVTVTRVNTADGTPDPWYAALLAHRKRHGAIAGPVEVWLALRGIRTLHVRLQRACANAAELARRLAEHPKVTRVRYPGWGAMLAIEVTGGPADAEAVAAACQVWLGATSLGGVESLIERRRRYPGESPLVPDTLLRLSVGIEDVEDLWRDLEQALG